MYAMFAPAAHANTLVNGEDAIAVRVGSNLLIIYQICIFVRVNTPLLPSPPPPLQSTMFTRSSSSRSTTIHPTHVAYSRTEFMSLVLLVSECRINFGSLAYVLSSFFATPQCRYGWQGWWWRQQICARDESVQNENVYDARLGASS